MILLSILIPSIPSRIESHLMPLLRELERQIGDRYSNVVEILAFTDNKNRSIGAKRQALLNLSQGQYIAFLDDDDRPEPDYISTIINHLVIPEEYPDVVTFKQRAIIDGQHYELTFQHGHPTNDELRPEGAIRPPWHVCFWRRDVVAHCTFPDNSYGEDWTWAEQANKKAKTSSHIDKIMMTYVFDSTISEAPYEQVQSE